MISAILLVKQEELINVISPLSHKHMRLRVALLELVDYGGGAGQNLGRCGNQVYVPHIQRDSRALSLGHCVIIVSELH